MPDADLENLAPDRARQTHRRWLATIVAAGAALRGGVLAAKWDQGLLLNDSLWYSGQALALSEGRFFEQFFKVSGAEHPPLTSIVIAPASWLPRPEFWQRATLTIVGIVSIVLIAMLAERLAGRRAALVAAAIAAVYPNIWMSDALIMSETLTIAAVTSVLLVAHRYRQARSIKIALMLGVAVGVATHARSELLLFAPWFALCDLRRGSWRERGAGALVIVAAASLTLVPWSAFNLARYERPVLMSTNDGTTLLGANCEATYYGHAIGGWVLGCLGDDLGTPGEDASQRSARQRHEAAAYAANHLDRTPVVVAARVGRTLDVYGLRDLVAGDVGEERWRWSVWAGIGGWWLLAPLAAVGGWRARRRIGGEFFAPAVAVAVTTVMFYGSHRLRVPLEPIVVVGAACSLVAVADIRSQRNALRRSSHRATLGATTTSGRDDGFQQIQNT